MVHMPIPIHKANKIPAAKAAVDAEWRAHMDKKTWDVSKVRPKTEVIAEATAKNESVHFGYLMDLCHLKHAELHTSLQNIRGESFSEVIKYETKQVTSRYSRSKEPQLPRCQRQNS